jgi:DcuC family C4-dicarboxylate transporter
MPFHGEVGSLFLTRTPGTAGELDEAHMGFAGFAALAIVAAAIVLVIRGWDVRLVLLAAALAISGMAAVDAEPDRRHAALAAVIREFLLTFSNEKFVVPICSAMGFAYVLRHTGCERHLVLLLVKPLRHVRWLLVPGIVAVGFLVNIPVISQTSTAVCIGPVVVPLMRAAGYSMPTIGACLLLGTSVGGELLNPGAPELLTVFTATGVPTTEQTRLYLPPIVFTQLAVSMLVFWALSVWWERRALSPSPARGEGSPRSGPVRGEADGNGAGDPSPGGEAPPPSPARGEGERTVGNTSPGFSNA